MESGEIDSLYVPSDCEGEFGGLKMSRSKPLIAYLKPSDKLKLQALAMMRNMSQSFVLVEAVQDAFVAAFGRNADPKSVIERYGPLFAGQEIATQRAKRRRMRSGPGMNQ